MRCRKRSQNFLQRRIGDLDIEDRHERTQKTRQNGDPGAQWYLLGWGGRHRSGSQVDGDRRRHPGDDAIGDIGHLRWIQHQLDRHTLDDFREVSGRIIGR